MSKWTEYRLHPRSAFRIGDQGIGLEETSVFIHADTLFGALMSAQVEMGDAGGWSTSLGEGSQPSLPPFQLTSAFPLVGDVRFYPLPLVQLAALGVDVDSRRKEVRRIDFVSEGIWQRITTGQSLASFLPTEEDEVSDGVLLQRGSLWMTRAEVAELPVSFQQRKRGGKRPLRALHRVPVWQEAKVPRVTVDRRGSGSAIFHAGRVTMAPECGLWFGVRWLAADEATNHPRESFEQALHVLVDAGLGSERSAGYGAFSASRGETRDWPDPEPGDYYVTLSRYHPAMEETPGAFDGVQTAYRLQSVGGYLYAPGYPARRRRRLWLAAEGSVLQAVGAGPYGDVVDVRPVPAGPQHPVWRYGVAAPWRVEVKV
jgi:CRISPR-associated protein Csm4